MTHPRLPKQHRTVGTRVRIAGPPLAYRYGEEATIVRVSLDYARVQFDNGRTYAYYWNFLEAVPTVQTSHEAW